MGKPLLQASPSFSAKPNNSPPAERLNARGFRRLRTATKGSAFGNRKPLEKGLTETFYTYVSLHCARINLYQSILSVFPLLLLVIKLCETRGTNPKSRTNYFYSKPLAAFHNRTLVRYHIRQRRRQMPLSPYVRLHCFCMNLCQFALTVL